MPVIHRYLVQTAQLRENGVKDDISSQRAVVTKTMIVTYDMCCCSDKFHKKYHQLLYINNCETA
eukprot:1202-Heterococcus_DN1.PRE.2